jgi:predicted DNA-binding protein with PD1-like motif
MKRNTPESRKRRLLLTASVLTGALAIAGSGHADAGKKEVKGQYGNQSQKPAAAPDVHTINSPLARIVVARLKNGTDLLAGIQEAVRREGVVNGVLLSAAGSLTRYHVHTVANTEFPPEDVYSKADGPYDLLTITGYVIGGRVHAHVTIVDDKKAFGGHLEPETTVFTFAIVTIGVLPENARLERFDDWTWN